MVRNPPPGFPMERAKELLEKGFDVNLNLEVEEYIAAYAENVIMDFDKGLVKQTFWQRLVAVMRQALRSIFGRSMTWTDNDIAHLLRNASKVLNGQITPRNSFDDIARL